jgi:hypothetical protein
MLRVPWQRATRFILVVSGARVAAGHSTNRRTSLGVLDAPCAGVNNPIQASFAIRCPWGRDTDTTGMNPVARGGEQSSVL